MSKTLNHAHKKELGNSGESYAVKDLEAKGYRILSRNYTVHNVGELDIVAEKNGEVYVFEVRTRLNKGYYPDSAESVTSAKRLRVERTAEHFLISEEMDECNVIFEVVQVTHDEQGNIVNIEYIPF